MKKVRYAIGALGAAPALGLVMPVTNAAATVTHSTEKPAAKTVSLEASRRAVCGGGHLVTNFAGSFYNSTFHSGFCIQQVVGLLGHKQAGLAMRTREYATSGVREFSHFVTGVAGGGHTYFDQAISMLGYKTCIALVLTNHHASVRYGPVCTTV
jgi:hypothetical protein